MIYLNELLILIGVIVVGIAIVFAGGYLVLKVTSYYKSRFGISMGPSVISVCLSIDLFLVASLLMSNKGEENFVLLFNIVAFLLFVYGMYRNIKYYNKEAIGAVVLQLLLGMLQMLFVAAAVATIIIRKLFKHQNTQLRTVLNWTKFIWNM